MIEEDGEVDDRLMTIEGKEKMEDLLQERRMDEKQMKECKKRWRDAKRYHKWKKGMEESFEGC